MTTSARRPSGRQNWVALATNAFRASDLKGARAAYIEALRQEPRNAQLHFEQAAVLAGLGEIEDSVAHLTEALRLKPQHEEAARRLSRLLGRFTIEDASRLNPFGLKAALGMSSIDVQPIAEAALKHLASTFPDLGQALRSAAEGKGDEAARRLILNRTSEALKSDLLLSALQAGVVMNPEYERLLTALRRILLLEVPEDRFEDRALYAFALAMLGQAWNNDHVWAETGAEIEALNEIAIDRAALLSGDLEMARRLLLFGLYRPVDTHLGPAEANACNGVRPKPFRDLLKNHLERRYEVQTAAAVIPRLAGLQDETSQRVARQYETNPYPRWQSLHVSTPGTLKSVLTRFFEPSRLEFMNDEFDVLIAGAGTGKQALQSAFAYGPNARLLGTDISAASLGYAQAAARRLGVKNVEFMVADILDLDQLGRQFDVIECIGVLHHMADPWAGWCKLLSCLKPGGLMYIGLYSAVSRANIQALRDEPDYPGPDCDDAAARAWRAELLSREAGRPGSELVISRDFYTLNEFRDLALHPSEQHVELDEVARFLDENGLEFRGFALDPLIIEAFARQFPDGPLPGTLVAWQEFERQNPRTFDAMYRFWCERQPSGATP